MRQASGDSRRRSSGDRAAAAVLEALEGRSCRPRGINAPTCVHRGHPTREGLWGQGHGSLPPPWHSARLSRPRGDIPEVHRVRSESPPASCRAGVPSQASSFHAPTDGRITTFQATPRLPRSTTAPEGSRRDLIAIWAGHQSRQGKWPFSCTYRFYPNSVLVLPPSSFLVPSNPSPPLPSRARVPSPLTTCLSLPPSLSALWDGSRLPLGLWGGPSTSRGSR